MLTLDPEATRPLSRRHRVAVSAPPPAAGEAHRLVLYLDRIEDLDVPARERLPVWETQHRP